MTGKDSDPGQKHPITELADELRKAGEIGDTGEQTIVYLLQSWQDHQITGTSMDPNALLLLQTFIRINPSKVAEVLATLYPTDESEA